VIAGAVMHQRVSHCGRKKFQVGCGLLRFILMYLLTLALSLPAAAEEPAAEGPAQVFEGKNVAADPVLSPAIARPHFEFNLSGREADVWPRLEGEASIELQNDNVFKSTDRDRKINDLYNTTELFLAARFTPELSLESDLVVEPVEEPRPGEDRYFGDTGLFAETLGLVYAAQTFSLFAGKLNPTFGVAWDLAPGIYGTDLGGDYELTERIGFGGSVGVPSEVLGEPTLTAQTFFADTTVFSRSLGKDRGRTRLKDGGVSNTQSFESFSATLDGDLEALSESLRYQLGVERQQHGRTENEDEWGVAAAVYGGFEPDATIDLWEGAHLAPVGEWVYLNDRDAKPNDVHYLTAGSALFLGPWNVAAVYTGRMTTPSRGHTFTDHAFQLSAGYQFEGGFAIDVGYLYLENEGIASHGLGCLLVYDFTFALF
jgi:hypothetical protein